MKKLLTLISVLIAACVACRVPAGAEVLPECDFVEAEYGYCDETGLSVQTKIGDADLAGTSASLNGYNTIQYSIPGTQSEVFLTGLKEDIVSRVETTITGLYSSNTDFNLTEDFIDAEKTRAEDGDDNMCWAAATSNVLRYTGWGFKADFNTEDDIFESFIKNFENKSGNTFNALAWFFNGLDLARDASGAYQGTPQATAARVRSYPISGAFLNDYTFDSYTKKVEFKGKYAGAKGLKELLELLHKGYGVVLNTDVYYDGRRMSGHSLTCWGMITDNRYPDTEKAHYRYILVSNSDSDMVSGIDRRQAKNVVTAYQLSSFNMGGADTFSFNFNVHEMGVLADSYALEPYKAEIFPETDPDATRDRIHNVDLLAAELLITDNYESEENVKRFKIGDSVYYGFVLRNMSSVPFEGKIPVEFILRNDKGRTVKANRHNVTLDIRSDDDVVYVFEYPINNLSGGDYTISMTWNPYHEIAEAFFFNNNLTYSFSVGTSYLCGDTDNDGLVTVADATALQRILLHIDTGLDEDAGLRADVDLSGDPDLTDVMFIQKFTVNTKLKKSIRVNNILYY